MADEPTAAQLQAALRLVLREALAAGLREELIALPVGAEEPLVATVQRWGLHGNWFVELFRGATGEGSADGVRNDQLARYLAQPPADHVVDWIEGDYPSPIGALVWDFIPYDPSEPDPERNGEGWLISLSVLDTKSAVLDAMHKYLGELWDERIEPLRRAAPDFEVRQRQMKHLERRVRSYLAWSLTADPSPAASTAMGEHQRIPRAAAKYVELWQSPATDEERLTLRLDAEEFVDKDYEALKPLIDRLRE